MKTTLTAIALAAALAQPAAAVTFPTLTTIYVASGVTDSGSAAETGVATVFSCSNVSGLIASVRFLFLRADGSSAGNINYTTGAGTAINHGVTRIAATHATALFAGASISGVIAHGVVNIESTQSAVFCTGMIVDAAATVPNGIDLHLVRVNPHPGTVE